MITNACKRLIYTDISQGIRSVFGAVRNYFGGKVSIFCVFKSLLDALSQLKLWYCGECV